MARSLLYYGVKEWLHGDAEGKAQYGPLERENGRKNQLA